MSISCETLISSEVVEVIKNIGETSTYIEYNDDLGCETINKEYKLLIFNPLLIEQEQSLELLRTGRWIFNQSIDMTLRNYLRIYLPKYIATYTHPLTKITKGEFYIGVNDDGLIHGIPYKGQFPIQIIQEEINHIFKNMIRIKGDNKHVKNIIKNKMTIKIQKINTFFGPGRNLIYEEFIQKSEEINSRYQKYLIQKRKKEELVIKYTNKLHEMLNNKETRYDIINYIKEKTDYMIKPFQNKYSSIYYLCETRDYYKFISELRSDFKYKSTNHDEIEIIKEDPTNIFHWVTKWKDSKNSMLRNFKPRSPRTSNSKTYPMFLLSQIHRMIPLWCRNNPELKLYLLKLSIPGFIDENSILEYMDISGNWIESYRKIEYGQPQSCPINPFFY